MTMSKIIKPKCPCGRCVHSVEAQEYKSNSGEVIMVRCKYSPALHLKRDDSYCKEYKAK